MAESNGKINENETITLIFDALRTICSNNIAYFGEDQSVKGIKLHSEFLKMVKYADDLEPLVKQVNDVAKLYDFDEKTPANGFRSFVIVVSASIKFCTQMGNRICVKRDGLLFRKGNIIREVESCNELLSSLSTSISHVITLTQWCPPGDLFGASENSAVELLLSRAEEINQYCFYGRCLGFQFCESMRSILKFLSLTMAIFSEAYYNEGSFLYKATNSVWSSGKYMLDPDTRARRIVNISQNSDVDFCKAYWFLAESEVMMQLPSLFMSSVAVNHVISIPPEPFQYLKTDGSSIDIPIPSAHIGTKPVPIRLISHVARQGMVGVTSKTNLQPPSPNLMIHCHGGGFVAQSSRSHVIYLREWAQQIGVPMASIDYSLAPEAPFPRAVEETFYAYCWAVQNCELLGSTGERIILAGDSAGGNLVLGTAMKCIEVGMRPPDGIFLAYVPVLVEFNPSPSRMLCIMDPLLPFGFMMRCLKAYASTDSISASKSNGTTSSDTESFEEVSESDLLELQAHKSPISETSDTITNVSLSSQPMSTSSKPSDSTLKENKNGQQYVAEYLDKYVLESDTDSDGTKVHLVQTTTSTQNIEDPTYSDQSLQQRFSGFVGALTSRITRWKNKKHVSPAELFLDADRQKNLVEEFKFTVPRDPYLSPYWAKDEILKYLPPVRILTVELDPCLDDCVMFAKKLKNLNNNVGLDVLPGLPHGFLNFATICKEAHHGSKVCIERIKELFDMTSERQDGTDN